MKDFKQTLALSCSLLQVLGRLLRRMRKVSFFAKVKYKKFRPRANLSTFLETIFIYLPDCLIGSE